MSEYRAVTPLQHFICFENYHPPGYLDWGNLWLNLGLAEDLPNVIPISAY